MGKEVTLFITLCNERVNFIQFPPIVDFLFLSFRFLLHSGAVGGGGSSSISGGGVLVVGNGGVPDYGTYDAVMTTTTTAARSGHDAVISTTTPVGEAFDDADQEADHLEAERRGAGGEGRPAGYQLSGGGGGGAVVGAENESGQNIRVTAHVEICSRLNEVRM